MKSDKSIFSQLMDFLPSDDFRKCVEHYQGDRKLQNFSCWDQFLCMAFAQLTYSEALQDIEPCLTAEQTKLYHLGICHPVSCDTLLNANAKRNWHIYADFAQLLIKRARQLYVNDDFGLTLERTEKALEVSNIDLSLSLISGSCFRTRKGTVKRNTLIDVPGNKPTVIIIRHLDLLDQLIFEPGILYVMDRAGLDFRRLHQLHLASAFFITRAHKLLAYRRLSSRPVDQSAGVVVDEIVTPTDAASCQGYPDKLRRIRYFDTIANKHMVFLTNNFTLSALAIARIIAVAGKLPSS
jgi:hypothetical protein